MRFFQFERRPVNPRAVYVACMIGLTFGIPAVMIVPRFIEVTAAKPLCIYDGAEYTIEDDGGDTVAIMSPGKPSRAVPRDEVTVIPRWQFWRYSSSAP